MSRMNNVNPDRYKVAGRDRPDDVARARRDVPPTGKPRRRKGDPALPPVGESPPANRNSAGEAERR